MTTVKENEILTQVGPGTLLGELMREYWLPAAQSSELEADGDPVRLVLLGEKLIAFRDTSGRVGVMDHRCPHRCASFFFGRNEENGIRCTYHGWKYDVDGNCVDMPNVPAHQDFRKKVPAKVYKAEERNGLVYVYMGKKKKPPPLPPIEACLVPEEEVEFHFVLLECNWLQAAEGELDSSHVGFLHFGAAQRKDFEKTDMSQYIVSNRAPEYYAKDTDFGVTYGSHRPGDKGLTYWRIAHFLFPCWLMPPIEHMDRNLRARAYVPLDDNHTMVVMVYKKPTDLGPGAPDRWFAGASHNYRQLPATTDWFGRYRRVDNITNDYNINRDLQRTGVSYTGIDGIQLQDQALQESMEPVVDRTFERLAPSDLMITQVRRRIIRAARAFKKSGTLPKNAKNHKLFDGVRGGHFQTDKKVKWEKAYRDALARAPVEKAQTLIPE